jgi:16S rRNA (adenine1518-N6/adenine1519-N6)-dimethyltransferase
MCPKIEPIAELRSPSKRRHLLGQHFLISQDASKKIASAAGLTKNDVVLEIGTGKGALTEKIAPLASKIVSYEKDHSTILEAKRRLSSFKNITLIEADVFEPGRSCQKFDVCVTSLPYSRSLDFLEWLAFRSGSFRLGVAVLQLDFARKLLALPGSANYKSASVIGQISFHMKIIDRVDRSNFQPPPRVESTIVRFEPNDKFAQPFFDLSRVRTLRRIFSFRGRTLRNALKNLPFKKLDNSVNTELLSKRVEKLSPNQLAQILENIVSD